MKFSRHREHVVVVGAGYAGLSCALELARQSRSRRSGEATARISLVAREGRQELTTELFRSLRTGDSEYFNFRPLLKKHDIRFIEGQATDIRPTQKEIQLKGASTETLSYDSLVIAAGRQTQLPEIAGLKELFNGNHHPENKVFLFKNNAQAQSLRFALRRLDWSKPSTRDIFVVIIGAGKTGLEVAGEIAAMRGSNRHARVIVVDSESTLVPGFSPIAQKMLKKELAGMHIETVLGSPAIRVEARELHIQNGQVIPWDLLVVCTGAPASAPFLRSFADVLDEKFSVITDSRCEIPGFAQHFAIGGIARIPRREDPLANTKMVSDRPQFAVQEGRFLASAIIARLKVGNADTPGPAFQARDLGYLLSLGPNNGLGRIGEERESRIARFFSPFIVGASIDKLKMLARARYIAQLKWGIP